MKKTVELRVLCGGPEETGSWRSCLIEADERTTVLDALERLRRSAEGDGAGGEAAPLYRHSCHHGSCGTCACMVNGVEKLSCTTRFWDLDTDVVTLEPLRSAEKIADLAVRPEALFRGLPDTGYLRKSESENGTVRFEDCIECGSCLSACPVRVSFMGPAALAAYERELENRPENRAEVLKSVGGKNGATACERNIFCSLVCPTKVAPAKKIMRLKTLLGQSGRPNPATGKK
jgi:succinate dehydrogenase / fumarate reductase iron-sulfur subunit